MNSRVWYGVLLHHRRKCIGGGEGRGCGAAYGSRVGGRQDGGRHDGGRQRRVMSCLGACDILGLKKKKKTRNDGQHRTIS